MNSATTIEHQIPLSPRISGRIITEAHSNRSVLRNEMTADVSPSLRAVKKAEPNMAIPAKIKETA